MSEVEFEGVTKRFGDVVAVDDLTLDVEQEEFMVLLGPSGCGKTTALRMVAGLETVSSGKLRIGGEVVNDVEAKDRNVSMVFQSYALYPHMTVAKNIESPLVARKIRLDDTTEPHKLTKSERGARVAEAAATLGLTDLLGRKPAALSGGQRQRVALARAIVSRPAAFLMDEPLSNLDAKLRAQTRIELVELHRRLATTFLYVTHDQVEAMTMATRMAIITDGRLQQVGEPQSVYARPANLFVARFIGSPPMNTIAGTGAIRDGEAYVDVGTGRFRVAPAQATSIVDGRPVVLGVRPEHLTHRDASSTASVPSKVTAVEWLGHERHLLCELDGVQVTLREPSAGKPPAAGSEIHLTADPAQVHLFDPASSERLP